MGVQSLLPRVPGLHFVGFRDDRYWNAVHVWGRPSVIHIGWDRRAAREIAATDTVVFARGSYDQAPADRNFNDLLDEETGQ